MKRKMAGAGGALRITAWLSIVLAAGCAALTPEEAPPSEKPAVVALLDTARSDADAGRMDAAAATLEHALRIEPRNALLWHELASLRMRQGQSDQAASLAAKSNALAGANRALKAKNWRLIAHARNERGDSAGANTALQKAEELER